MPTVNSTASEFALSDLQTLIQRLRSLLQIYLHYQPFIIRQLFHYFRELFSGLHCRQSDTYSVDKLVFNLATLLPTNHYLNTLIQKGFHSYSKAARVEQHECTKTNIQPYSLSTCSIITTSCLDSCIVLLMKSLSNVTEERNVTEAS
jgi:hypothetical protein